MGAPVAIRRWRGILREKRGRREMAQSGEAVKDALAAEAEAVQELEAARAEHDRGKPMLSADLLIEAIEKEKESLQLWEEAVETLRQALLDRRQALDQQQELLTELVQNLQKD